MYTHVYIHAYSKSMEAQGLPYKLPLYSKFKAWGFKPLVIDFYLQRIWPSFSLERIFAKVLSVCPAASGIVTIRLKPNFNFKNFEAGQHVLLTSTVNGHRMTRTYSPTRLLDNSLEITVKKIEGGKVSANLTQNLKRGSMVEITSPFGEMTWSQLPIADHYDFCAGGVGITPLRSLIHVWDMRNDLHAARTIDLHYWAKTKAEHCFVNELGEIASRHSGLRLHFYTSVRAEEKVQIADVIMKIHESVVVACGPRSFVHSAKAIAETNSLKFVGEHAQVASSTDSNSSLDERFFEINYGGKTVLASSKKSILESLEMQGFEPVHACRMGLCKSCTCMKREGITLSAKDQSYSTEANEEIQICVASPRSPIILERY